MNKTAIKNFAVWARRKLISDITYKAQMLGITDKGIAEALPISTKDLQFFDIGTKDYAEISGNEIKQREKLVQAIKAKEKSSKTYKEAFEYIVEEVAYTWFNRLIAIRFMEVNDYLPSGIRVLSSENPAKSEPDFVTTPFDTDIDFTPFEQDKVIQLKDENKLDELFRMLFIKQCNKLYEILPELFEKTDDYTELLLTISFTDKDGVVSHLIHDIEEKDFNVAAEGQVEIIGWLYQYYNTEPKDTVFTNLKKNIKISKENIPAATQLFTPDWIVRYMVENSLGRFWLDGHSNDNLKSEWKYYLEEAEQEQNVQKQLEEIKAEHKNITPEQIKVIDPCMGSGHILVYAFDVLMQIYESYGYTQRDAARSILTNNIHGLDIDTRAYQLAYFAVMMKARQYNRRILTEGIKPNLFAIKESNDISNDLINFIANDNNEIKLDLTTILGELKDAKEYGSIIDVSVVDYDRLYNRINDIVESFYDDIFGQGYQIETTQLVLPLIKQAQTMAQKYDVVITNPPYMGASGMSPKLSKFLKENYEDSKNDLFAAFIEKCLCSAKQNGYVSMITMQAWLFLSSYVELRRKITDKNIQSLLQIGFNSFPELNSQIAHAVAFNICNSSVKDYFGKYYNLNTNKTTDDKEQVYLRKKDNNEYYLNTTNSFLDIPNYNFAYWLTENEKRAILASQRLGDCIDIRQGLATGNNEKFLRLWFEIIYDDISFNSKNIEDFHSTSKKYAPYNKGGNFRRWYGNNENVIRFDTANYNVLLTVGNHLPSREYYFRTGITWSLISTNNFAARLSNGGFVFDVGGSSGFPKQDWNNYYLGLLCSKISFNYLQAFNPTINFQVGDIKNIPAIEDIKAKENIDNIVNDIISMAQADWDSFETSWDFKKHPIAPLIRERNEQEISQFSHSRMEKFGRISWHYERWEQECNDRFNQLKANEEKLNNIFIDIYNLHNELTAEVDEKGITIRKADLQREIKSLISYSVGCMLGRYSLDIEGIAYAGGEWDNTKYSTFVPDADNCIPITDEEYFEDDIVGRFVKFVETVYGKETLEENLSFIANALGNKGTTSREIIRNYFLNDFIKDHIKIYQKRPIYWLYDSGKQNGFKALVYMHRYNADTTGNMRVEYLHRMQTVYEKELERMQDTIDNSSDNKEISAANKRKEKLQKQLKETKDFDAKVAHLALSRIDIDLDDGVKVNYEKVQTASDGTKLQILAKI